jgi:hypothetical protein
VLHDLRSPDDLSLTKDERSVLGLGQALGPFEVDADLAKRLGLLGLADLWNVVGFGDRARAGAGLERQQWLVLIDAVRTLADPDDTEWQTVTGFVYEETVALLASVESKVLRTHWSA